MIKIARIPLESNLSAFSDWLHSQGYKHLITEELGEQVLFLNNADKEVEVKEA